MISPYLDHFSQTMAKSMWLHIYISLLAGKLGLLIKWYSLKFGKLLSFSCVSPEEQRKCSVQDKYLFLKGLNERTKTTIKIVETGVLNKKSEDLLAPSLPSNSKLLQSHFAKTTYRKFAASPKLCIAVGAFTHPDDIIQVTISQ